MHRVPALSLGLGKGRGKGLVRHANTGFQGDAGAGAAMLRHLLMQTAAALFLAVRLGGRVDLPPGKVRMGGDQRGSKTVLISLFPLHKAPVHPVFPVQHLKLFRRKIFHPALHLGNGVRLAPGVLRRDPPHDLPLGDHSVPQNVHPVGGGVLGLDIHVGAQALAVGAVLGLGPVLSKVGVDAGNGLLVQIGVDPLDGLLIIPGGFQPLHIVGQAHVQAAERFVQISCVHIFFPLS